MRKSTVTKLFIGSAVAVGAGIMLAFASVAVALWSGSFVIEGSDVVDIRPNAGAWTMLVLAMLAVIAVIGGAIGGLEAWIGALLNTARLEDKMWFVLLLVLGLVSFGWVAMIAYVVAGPDGMANEGTGRLGSTA